MTISALIASVNENLLALGPPNGPDGQPLSVFLGPEHLARQWSPPRIVAVPPMRGDKYGTKSVSFKNAAGHVLPAIGTLHQSLEVHFWGRDYGATEELRRIFFVALYATAPGLAEWLGGGWNNDTKIVQMGREYIALVAIGVPITSGPWTETPAEPMPKYGAADDVKSRITAEMDFPDGTSEIISIDPTGG